MAILIKMARRTLDGVEHHVCIVNEAQLGSEFTLCGNAWVDSTLDTFDVERESNPYRASLKNATCPRCLAMVSYIKRLR